MFHVTANLNTPASLPTIAGSQALGDRPTQEDAWNSSSPTKDGELFAIVADGIGGAPAGDQAAQIVVNKVTQVLADTADSSLAPQQRLARARDKANQAIAEITLEKPHWEGMGTTLVASMICDGQLWWTSVGDSHLYHLSGTELRKLNACHCLGAELGTQSTLGHILTSCLDGKRIKKTDAPTTPVALHRGDKLLLASDGLDSLDSDQITQLLRAGKDAEDTARSLVAAAKTAPVPHHDNVTAVVINI